MVWSICHKKRAAANRKKAQSEYQFELVSRPTLQQSPVGWDVQCVAIWGDSSKMTEDDLFPHWANINSSFALEPQETQHQVGRWQGAQVCSVTNQRCSKQQASFLSAESRFRKLILTKQLSDSGLTPPIPPIFWAKFSLSRFTAGTHSRTQIEKHCFENSAP